MAKLIGAVTFCCETTYSSQRQSDDNTFLFFPWSTPPSAQCRGANRSRRIKASRRRNKSRKWQIAGGRKGKKKKSLTSHILLILQFLWCVYIKCGIRQQSDMRHGKLSLNPIWNGCDKVPGKFRGTERAGRRAKREGKEIEKSHEWAVTLGETSSSHKV